MTVAFHIPNQPLVIELDHTAQRVNPMPQPTVGSASPVFLVSGVVYPAVPTGAKQARGVAVGSAFAAMRLNKQSFHQLAGAVAGKSSTTLSELHDPIVRLAGAATGKSQGIRCSLPSISSLPPALNTPRVDSSVVVSVSGFPCLYLFPDVTTAANGDIYFAFTYGNNGTTPVGIAFGKYTPSTQTFTSLASWAVGDTIDGVVLASTDLPFGGTGSAFSPLDRRAVFCADFANNRLYLTTRSDSPTRSWVFSVTTAGSGQWGVYLTNRITTYPAATTANSTGFRFLIASDWSATSLTIIYTSEFTQSGKSYCTPHAINLNKTTGATTTAATRMLGNAWGTTYKTMFVLGVAQPSSDPATIWLKMAIADDVPNYRVVAAWVTPSNLAMLQTLPASQYSANVDVLATGAVSARRQQRYVSGTWYVDDTHRTPIEVNWLFPLSGSSPYVSKVTAATVQGATTQTSLTTTHSGYSTEGSVPSSLRFDTNLYRVYLLNDSGTLKYTVVNWDTGVTGAVSTPVSWGAHSARFAIWDDISNQDPSAPVVYHLGNRYYSTAESGLRVTKILFDSTTSVWPMHLDGLLVGSSTGSLSLSVITNAQSHEAAGLLAAAAAASVDVTVGTSHELAALVAGLSTATLSELRSGGVPIDGALYAVASAALDLRIGMVQLAAQVQSTPQVQLALNAHRVHQLQAACAAAVAADAAILRAVRASSTQAATSSAVAALLAVQELAAVGRAVAEAECAVWRGVPLGGAALSRVTASCILWGVGSLGGRHAAPAAISVFTSEEAIWVAPACPVIQTTS